MLDLSALPLPAAVVAAALLLALPLAFLLLRPRKPSLALSSWPHPLWIYAQALAAIGKKPSKAQLQDSGCKAIQVMLTRPVNFSSGRLRRYLQLAGFSGGTAGAVPLLYPLVEGFRLVMQAMVLPAFPFNVLGSVLGRTRVVMVRRLGAEEKLMYSCRVDPALRTTAKGDTEVDLIVEAYGLRGAQGPAAAAAEGSSGTREAGYELVWRSVTTAIILSPRRGSGRKAAEKELASAADSKAGGEAATPQPAAGPAKPTVIDTWQLGSDTGRSYGMLNGDLNPIHLYSVTSRLFGFKRPIAHALFLTGRAEGSMRSAGLQLRYPCALSADFKRPTLLPATLHCVWLGPGAGPSTDTAALLEAPGGARFAVLTEDMAKEVLVGAISCHPDHVREALQQQ